MKRKRKGYWGINRNNIISTKLIINFSDSISKASLNNDQCLHLACKIYFQHRNDSQVCAKVLTLSNGADPLVLFTFESYSSYLLAFTVLMIVVLRIETIKRNIGTLTNEAHSIISYPRHIHNCCPNIVRRM